MRPGGLRPAVVLGLTLLTLLAGCTTTGRDGAAQGSDGAAAPTIDSALAPCPRQPDEQVSGAQTLPKLRLRCLGGGALDLSRAPGAPTVVNLWGSWCGPCREELPLLQQFATAAGDRVRVLGVISKDGVPQAETFAADAGVTFPSAFDGEGKLMTALGVNALPYTYLLDAHGAVAYTQVGPVHSVDEFRALVAAHLGVQL